MSLLRLVAPALLALAIAASASHARADRLLLADGGSVEGEIRKEGGVYHVKLPSGIEVSFPQERVLRIESASDARARYEKRLRALEETDVAGHYKLASFCLDNGLRGEAEERFRHVVRLDPAHEDAHRALGEVFYEGRWIAREEANRLQGLVLHEGKWVTEEERLRLVSARRTADERTRLTRLVKRIRRGIEPSRSEAIAEIEAMDDPCAVEPLLAACEHWHKDVRIAAATAVARFGADERVAKRLHDLASRDGSLAVQDAAARAIREHRVTGAAERLVLTYMDDERSWVRNAAAHALGVIRYRPAVPVLVATLVYEVRDDVATPIQLGTVKLVTVDAGCHGRLRLLRTFRIERTSFRLDTEAEVTKAKNDAAREALALLTGVNHDFDVHAWVGWWKENRGRFDDFMAPADKNE